MPDDERMAVLSYLFRRVERLIEDRRPTVIVVDEAWKALDTSYFAERLSNWLVTARKQNAVVVMMTQYASQLEHTRTGRTIDLGAFSRLRSPSRTSGTVMG